MTDDELNEQIARDPALVDHYQWRQILKEREARIRPDIDQAVHELLAACDEVLWNGRGGDWTVEHRRALTELMLKAKALRDRLARAGKEP